MKNVRFVASLLIPCLILFMPLDWLPLEGITLIEKRVVAIFFFAALFWILEPIPVYATSLLIIFLELFFLSDKGLTWLVNSEDPIMGTVIPYADIIYTFASPIIILFLGGFFLAMAATKYRLDQNLARVLLAPFGSNPRYVMLGLMMITAVFSMFMSNTATTAMMLSILTPVLAVFDVDDKGKIAFALSIPVAANVGGIGTPIGTPPNAVALKYLVGDEYISFGEWMMFATPYVIVLLLIGWFLLLMLYPVKTQKIQLEIKGRFQKGRNANIVYATFVITILLWLTDFIHGMNAYVVAMFPVALFSATGIINKNDLKGISWDVLWLVSGGIALGLALEKSGLAARVISSIPFDSLSPLLIAFLVSILAAVMANFMSNTATANLLLPLVAALGTSIASLEEIGGSQMIILITTIACSMGMALPISTPPNALAFGTGIFETKDMTRQGVILAIIGLALSYALMFILHQTGYFS